MKTYLQKTVDAAFARVGKNAKQYGAHAASGMKHAVRLIRPALKKQPPISEMTAINTHCAMALAKFRKTWKEDNGKNPGCDEPTNASMVRCVLEALEGIPS